MMGWRRWESGKGRRGERRGEVGIEWRGERRGEWHVGVVNRGEGVDVCSGRWNSATSTLERPLTRSINAN